MRRAYFRPRTEIMRQASAALISPIIAASIRRGGSLALSPEKRGAIAHDAARATAILPDNFEYTIA